MPEPWHDVHDLSGTPHGIREELRSAEKKMDLDPDAIEVPGRLCDVLCGVVTAFSTALVMADSGSVRLATRLLPVGQRPHPFTEDMGGFKWERPRALGRGGHLGGLFRQAVVAIEADRLFRQPRLHD